MHIPSRLPLALLLTGASAWATTTQVTFQTPSSSSTTLVDALGADPDYSSLLRLLQRTRLIPTLNRLNGSTFFAPTNDAISKQSLTNSLWLYALEDTAVFLPDNVQERLRQQLFYHLLNATIIVLPTENQILEYTTLLYPRKPLDPPSHEPPPYPPWMPIPGGTLGGEPQRIRVAAQGKNANVAVDAFGKDGVRVVKGVQDAGNGMLLGIDQVIEPPPDLATIISRQPHLSYFYKIMTPDVLERLNSSSAITLFLPIDAAWKALDPIERLYLESEFASDVLQKIFGLHAVAQKHVTWSDSFTPGLDLTTVEGTKLDIVVAPEGTNIGNATLVQPDIYASNGVVHLVSSLLIPPDALQLTPEKYLLALNCTRFVSLLHSANLTGLINDTATEYTILAPKDEILSILLEGPELPEPGSEALKKLLQYHFIPGKWTPNKLKNGGLLETMLEEPGLNLGRQVLSVEVEKGDKKQKSEDKSISFGGASVIGKPIEVKNALLYFISRPIVPPPDALQAALQILDFSTFLAGIFSTTKAELLRTAPSTTLLIPRNQAFKRLGLLVSGHLLAPSSKDDLEKVILHHVLNTVEYAHSFNNGSQHSFATLEGTDLKIERLSDGTVYTSPSGGWDSLKAELTTKDLLTRTGVIHELSDVMIPRSVELTIGKLTKAAKGSTMATLVNKAGFEWIMNGTAPPEGSPWADEKYGNVGWTLLCPPDDAFKGVNLTRLYSEEENLRAIVSQHLIPTVPTRADGIDDPNPLYNNRPLNFEDATYSTVQSSSSAYGDLLFQRKTDSKELVVGIKGARGTKGKADFARVISWGRSTSGSGTGGVIQIDRLLVPYQPSWWFEYGAPTVVGGLAPAAEETIRSTTSAAESAKSFIAGGFGGVCAVLVGHPFDLTKTRMQTAAPGAYKGALDVVKKTVAQDGITGLYRGMVPPLLGVTPIFAVSFWAYDASKQLIYAVTPNRTLESLSLVELATAGFLSAVPTTLVTAPVERAKVLLQASLSKRNVQGQGGSAAQYSGVTDVLKHLYKEGGVRSIFRGTGATLARDGPGSAAYFAAYEITKKALTPAGSSPSELNLGAIIVAGGTAGVAMWALAIPPDVLKSRIQSAPTGTYSGLLDCARKTIAQDGVRALWKGFGPAMARAFPANAATFLGVEASRKVLDGIF
ncbi:carnitine/acyl carnitine carrier [Pholiota conissans]|uniref:Carnitine/acyl carnitine carrier n=1 Tax=Pholiota conissans TaxID=109636 RepID=A0A9P5Z1I9_9AGAR|nr:carnitine/acyl carnitine carrier [Pholiota conissans]